MTSNKNVKTLLISGFGINSEKELQWCFQKAGSQVTIVHVGDLIAGRVKLKDFDILGFPGGFSFGDHIASGRVLANKIKIYLGDQLAAFVKAKKPIIGICNGFQTLVRLGLLPFPTSQLKQEITLTHNDNHQFENRWVRLKIKENSPCVWTKGIKAIYLPVRHGEGRVILGDTQKLQRLQSENLDVLAYADSRGQPTQVYPDNPNGSEGSIAGLTDTTGLILGLMPHPEAFRWRVNAPGWKTRKDVFSSSVQKIIDKKEDGDGMAFFYNAVSHVKNRLK